MLPAQHAFLLILIIKGDYSENSNSDANQNIQLNSEENTINVNSEGCNTIIISSNENSKIISDFMRVCPFMYQSEKNTMLLLCCLFLLLK